MMESVVVEIEMVIEMEMAVEVDMLMEMQLAMVMEMQAGMVMVAGQRQGAGRQFQGLNVIVGVVVVWCGATRVGGGRGALPRPAPPHLGPSVGVIASCGKRQRLKCNVAG